ncbi:MAG TPA: ferredoxin [Solirubrobacteraceae bacterium]|nr:ferredoxin [Solirubrobacteraceae bacterium]
MSERLQVDMIACSAHGMCAELLPERVTLDDWGYPIVSGAPVPAELAGVAQMAVDACPVLALKLVRAQAAHAAGRRR